MSRENDARRAWERYRSHTSPPLDPLFRCDADPSAEPGERMREVLRDLEERAVQLDTLEAELGEPSETTSAKRRFLLVYLAKFGLLDPTAADAKLRATERWGCPTIAGYHRAACGFAEYIASPERAALGLPASPPLGGARLSIDWFRRPIRPEHAWSARCERDADEQLPGCAGDFGRWSAIEHTFHWRSDDGVSLCVYRVD